jgi:hypothetical protein
LFFVLSGYVLLIKVYKSSRDRVKCVDGIKRGLMGRWPRLWLPTSFTAMIYYSWLHFGPYHGGLVCHAPGDIDQYSFWNATYYSGGNMLLNAFLGQWFWQDSIYSIQWTLQIEFLYSIVVYVTAYAITSTYLVNQQGRRWAVYLLIILFLPICSIAFWGNFVPKPAAYIVPFSVGVCKYRAHIVHTCINTPLSFR